MRAFLVTKTYDVDDTEHYGDPWDVSLSEIVGAGDVFIFSGDYYHDRIDDKWINGFFACLDYLEIDYVRNTLCINKEM